MQQTLPSQHFMLQSWLQDSNSVLCVGLKYDIIKYLCCASDIQVRQKHNKLCSNKRCDQSFCCFQKLHYGCSVLQCQFLLLQAPPKHWTVALQPVRYMPVHTTTSKYTDHPPHPPAFIYLSVGGPVKQNNSLIVCWFCSWYVLTSTGKIQLLVNMKLFMGLQQSSDHRIMTEHT